MFVGRGVFGFTSAPSPCRRFTFAVDLSGVGEFCEFCFSTDVPPTRFIAFASERRPVCDSMKRRISSGSEMLRVSVTRRVALAGVAIYVPVAVSFGGTIGTVGGLGNGLRHTGLSSIPVPIVESCV